MKALVVDIIGAKYTPDRFVPLLNTLEKAVKIAEPDYIVVVRKVKMPGIRVRMYIETDDMEKVKEKAKMVREIFEDLADEYFDGKVNKFRVLIRDVGEEERNAVRSPEEEFEEASG